ncbi:hypothetical protein COW36_15350 [bacterium (Candidatus Blackallbacteria) CG17_big_fil_post_rev_8_21_14_2_50_48_46]|uniref:histidine kinase n=1 Tax=bacterium (Candidatus Blackallbacteria) CG17_big_fil_post_rev_8_21_14_2_50_48_46 TaxID=2014261 RepID=A0A2M7G2Y0_9BACT|nr:MAG: hypothetical protein COW64_11200 [bacterium (Candidatus Blackallbacteria) CG18_big_fil_WC_8_21_14_2_50_49_26]PIW16085.1 MAG: hypothetical protein COW36_15350 [bacterium (Candidatus Blackallbacteria) CG17_big_fil_post_rev_8_21_14_2_50_48_46]PIW50497.1 MAG: hypothetical protein COW20_03065 [bacterium (Candidatus Blackallbacteria) CG13_big_fil_rev_8_21_14_2_50_49_14]
MEMQSLILLIDDNKDSLQVLADILQRQGYLVTAANHPYKALKLIERVKPDLILCDILMPDMSGIELSKKIHEQSDFQDVPLIFLTGKSETDDVLAGFEAGGVDYICKPFNQAELLARVSTHLELKHARDQLALYTQHLRVLNQEKYDLLHIAAHELRNPLNAISLIAQAMKNAKNTFPLEKIHNIGSAILRDIQLMATITSNLLELDQLESQRLKPRFEKVNLCDFVVSCGEDFKSLAQEYKIGLNIQTDPDCSTMTDPLLLKQIVHNLLGNAFKFSPSGSQVELGLAFSGSQHRIWVKDQGPGFSQADRSRLYQKFARLSAQPLRHELSTGLGLAIVKKLADLLAIQIELDSEPGQGACFTLYFEPLQSK